MERDIFSDIHATHRNSFMSRRGPFIPNIPSGEIEARRGEFCLPSIAPHDDGPLGDRMADDDAVRHIGILHDELFGGVLRREYEQGCASVHRSVFYDGMRSEVRLRGDEGEDGPGE